MDEVGLTISEVEWLQLAVNTGFGFMAGVSLWLLGVPGVRRRVVMRRTGWCEVHSY